MESSNHNSSFLKMNRCYEHLRINNICKASVTLLMLFLSSTHLLFNQIIITLPSDRQHSWALSLTSRSFVKPVPHLLEIRVLLPMQPNTSLYIIHRHIQPDLLPYWTRPVYHTTQKTCISHQLHYYWHKDACIWFTKCIKIVLTCKAYSWTLLYV